MNKDLESIMRDAGLDEDQMRFTGGASSHCAHQLAQQGRDGNDHVVKDHL